MGQSSVVDVAAGLSDLAEWFELRDGVVVAYSGAVESPRARSATRPSPSRPCRPRCAGEAEEAGRVGPSLLTLRAQPAVAAVPIIDQNYLAVAQSDGSMSVFVLDVHSLVERARFRVMRSLSSTECERYLHESLCPPAPPLDLLTHWFLGRDLLDPPRGAIEG